MDKKATLRVGQVLKVPNVTPNEVVQISPVKDSAVAQAVVTQTAPRAEPTGELHSTR